MILGGNVCFNDCIRSGEFLCPDMLVLEVVYLTNVRGLSDVVRGSRTDRHQYVEVSDMRETYVCHLAVCCVV
jgi:hypothetical protein